jgi:hypothetical protein
VIQRPTILHDDDEQNFKKFPTETPGRGSNSRWPNRCAYFKCCFFCHLKALSATLSAIAFAQQTQNTSKTGRVWGKSKEASGLSQMTEVVPGADF